MKFTPDLDRNKRHAVIEGSDVQSQSTGEQGVVTVPTETSVETLLKSGIAHEVWSPHESFKAAQQLQDMLEE